MTLVVDWASPAATRHAVTRWHYSHKMPVGRLAQIGAWDDTGTFFGAVVFNLGGAQYGKSFGVEQRQCAELIRLALRRDHPFPVTQVVARALRMIQISAPELRVVVSYADPEHGHHGGIYQAGNWTYLGESAASKVYILANGERRHARTMTGQQFGRQAKPPPVGGHWVDSRPKHKYALGLDRAMRKQINARAVPYPPPCGGGLEGETSSYPDEGGGSTPSHRSLMNGR